jgi:hypothetical protein
VKKKMYKTLCIVAFVLVTPLALLAQDILGWRVPRQSELADNLGWRKEDPNLYLGAKADFDGDGKEDQARLLINDKENKMGLFRNTQFSKAGKSTITRRDS